MAYCILSCKSLFELLIIVTLGLAVVISKLDPKRNRWDHAITASLRNIVEVLNRVFISAIPPLFIRMIPFTCVAETLSSKYVSVVYFFVKFPVISFPPPSPL